MESVEFDYNEALGDTIMEKYESLYVLLCQCNEKNPIRFAIGHKDIVSIFEIMDGRGFKASPVVSIVGELAFVGQAVGNKFSWQVYKANYSAADELVLFGESGNTTVKFKNWAI